MTEQEARTEYERRNILHCRTEGCKAGIQTALARLTKQKRPPQWLIELLEVQAGKLPSVSEEMAKHRDELYDAAWKDAF